MEKTLLFAMLIFNAVDETTELAPVHASPGIKLSALKIYRLIVDLVENGEIDLFEKSSLFRAALREFIRNLSRMADELLPFVSYFTQYLYASLMFCLVFTA